MSWTRIKHRVRLMGVVGVAATVGMAAVVPGRARAELLKGEAAEVVKDLKEGYGYISLAISIVNYFIGGKAPTMAEQLQAVEAAIISELRTQRNLAWKEEAQDAFDDFEILAVRSRTDSQNEAMRWAAWQLSQGSLNYYAGLVEAVRGGLDDFTTVYQLAPTFNTLLLVHTALTRMRTEINPANHVPWGEFDIYLKRGIQADYALIGAQKVWCWPGYNPARNNYHNPFDDGRLTNSKLFTRSLFWTKKWWGSVVYEPPQWSPCRTTCVKVDCSYNFAATYPRDCTCIGSLVTTPIALTNACKDESMAWTVDYVQKFKFTANPTVGVIRAGMNGILAIGGGDDRWDGPNTTLPEQGMMTDPWVDESLCTNMPGNGGAPNPWAYPVTP